MPELRRSDGCRLHFETYGDRGAAPIVLLEGMGGDIPGWRRSIPRLSAEFFVVAYDFRGNGRSDAPDEMMTIVTFVEDTVDLLDYLDIVPAHIYGQSFGGMVAQELALAHPEVVRTLVLACTHCGGSHATRRETAEQAEGPHLALYSTGFAERHPEHLAEDLEVGSRNPQQPQAGRRQWEAMLGFDSYDRLPEIVAPTLVLHGTDDRLVPVENAFLLAARIPRAELVLLRGAGHLYHSEQPEAADAAVLRFIRRHP